MKLSHDEYNINTLKQYHSDYDRGANSRENIYQDIKREIINDLSKNLQELIDRHLSIDDHATGHDEYMRGLSNGMILSLSTLTNISPEYIKYSGGNIEDTQESIDLESSEQYHLQMAAISLASQGYWECPVSTVKPEYETQTLKDVIDLYKKYIAQLNNNCSTAKNAFSSN